MTTLYLTEQHAYVQKDHDALVVRLPDASKVSVPLLKVDQVVVMGDVTLTAAAIQALLEEGKEICFCTQWGRFRGRLTADWTKNSLLRIEQHRTHNDPARSLALSQAIVGGKLTNMRALLLRAHRRHPDDLVATAAERLQEGVDAVSWATSLQSLLGVEGDNSAVYFSAFGRLVQEPFAFHGRAKRTPPDPINALLSFGYTVLTNTVASAISVVGMDPYVGFLHSVQYGKPSLALDLVEEFRPLIVDSTVLMLVNSHALQPDDFELSDQARKTYIAALEERLQVEIEHPVARRRVPYRRCIELQVRLVGRYLAGEIGGYAPFHIR